MLKAPKISNRAPLKTGGLTSQTKLAVDKKPLFTAAGTSAPISQIATTQRATDILNVGVTQTVTIQSDEKKSSGGTPTITESTKGALAKFDNLVGSSKNQQTPKFPPPKQDSSVQIKADVYNADPQYFDVKLRPEILLLSQFKPLYNSSQDDLTEEGQLFELQVSSLRNTESDASKLLKQTIGESGIKESNDKFKSQITVLRDNLQNLDYFIKKIGTYKSSLNIATDGRYKFTPGKFVETNLLNSKDVINGFYTISNGSNVSYDLGRALIEARNVDTKEELDAIRLFSSSKLFLICINELNKMIKTHSYGIFKKKIKNSLVSKKPDEEKYNLISLQQDQRISVLDLTSGITKFSDLSSTGDERFQTIENKLKSSISEYIPFIFHLCFKDLIQKTRFELSGKDNSIENRTDVLDSFIGYYPSAAKQVYDAAQSKENVFTGDKLSDLAFFGNLNDQQKKVLVLEDGSSNNFPTSISSGEDYLFSSGNAENFFTSTYNINRIRDFKNFLDKVSNQAFENLVDLGIIPIDDSTALSTGKGFTSLSSINVFYQLFNILVLEQTLSNGEKNLKPNLISTPEVEKGLLFEPFKGFVKGTGEIGIGATKFTDNDLISLFTYYNNLKPLSTYGMRNAFYSYIYHRAVGGDASEPNFVKDVSKKIINILFNDVLESKLVSAEDKAPNPTSIIKKIGGVRADWELLVSNALIGSVFIDKIVSFFKQFLSLEDLLPTFFRVIQDMTARTTPVFVKALDLSGIYPNLVLTVYTHYDKRGDKKISEDLYAFRNKTSSTISNEMIKMLNLTFSILSTIQTLNKNITSTLNELETFDQTIPNYLLRYLNNDEKKLSTLFKEPQLMLLLSTVEDVYQSYTGFSTEKADKSQLFIKKEETLPHSTKIVELLRNYFSNAQFRFNQGYNKQIISVGLPQGLLKNLNEVLKSKKSKNAKHDDIFSILVYKMDLLNPFIIYKPKKFLFEASRFIDRVYSDIANVDKNVAIYKTIPTRNYSLYADPNLIKEGNPYLGTDLSNAFGDEYDFLSTEEKQQILANHSRSFLLENYLRLISGLNLNELTFNDIPAKEAKELSLSFGSNNPYLIDILGQGISDFNRIATSKNYGLNKAATIAIPDPDPYISKLLQPKRFDRVFNIIFDPEFVVDYDAMKSNISTEKNDLSTSTFNMLLDNKKFKYYSNSKDPYVDVDKGPNDIAMNTYFVSIETHATVSK
jgi:hypothetical protein